MSQEKGKDRREYVIEGTADTQSVWGPFQLSHTLGFDCDPSPESEVS